MPQIERVSAQLVELIEDLGDQVRSAFADAVVTAEEALQVGESLDRVAQVAMSHDEDLAIGIAIIRTGNTGQRSQRLLRQREDRLSYGSAA